MMMITNTKATHSEMKIIIVLYFRFKVQESLLVHRSNRWQACKLKSREAVTVVLAPDARGQQILILIIMIKGYSLRRKLLMLRGQQMKDTNFVAADTATATAKATATATATATASAAAICHRLPLPLCRYH